MFYEIMASKKNFKQHLSIGIVEQQTNRTIKRENWITVFHKNNISFDSIFNFVFFRPFSEAKTTTTNGSIDLYSGKMMVDNKKKKKRKRNCSLNDSQFGCTHTSWWCYELYTMVLVWMFWASNEKKICSILFCFCFWDNLSF